MSTSGAAGSIQPGVAPAAPIVDEIARAQRRRSTWFRVIFFLTWVVLIGALVAPLLLAGSFDVGFVQEWGPYILGGATTTILITVLSITLAVVLAVLGALGRLSRNPVINGVASLYVSLIRGTPLLVQIYFWFFGLAQIGTQVGLKFLVLPEIVAGVGALAFNYGAYMTEIFRAGIQAVPRGQREAAQALGMREGLIFRRIILPQAFRIVIPAIGNDFIAMIKDTSLVSVIAIQELTWRSQTAGRREVAIFEALLVAALVYWVLTIVFSFFQERLEQRLARSDR
jgi:polar amino acid transport system permease protein